MVWATPGPPLTLSLPTALSLPRKHQFIAQNRVLDVLVHDFSISLLSPSLLLNLENFSLVCDSSACPSRFVFSGLYFEYFAVVGDRL